MLWHFNFFFSALFHLGLFAKFHSNSWRVSLTLKFICVVYLLFVRQQWFIKLCISSTLNNGREFLIGPCSYTAAILTHLNNYCPKGHSAVQSHICPSGRRVGKADLSPLSWCCFLLSTQEPSSSWSTHSTLTAHTSVSVAFWEALPFCLWLLLPSKEDSLLFMSLHVVAALLMLYYLLSHLFTICEDWPIYAPTGLNISKSHSPAVAVNSWHASIFVFFGCSASPGLFTACTLLRSLVSPLHISCITWGSGSSS